MAPKSPEVQALDRFGRDVVTEARDRVIWSYDTSLSSAPKQPIRVGANADVQQTDADFMAVAALSSDVQRSVRRLIVESINETLHHLLWRISEEHDAGKATLTFDEIELLSAALRTDTWSGLYGGCHGEDGWYARFSKYGESGDRESAVP